jgi:hypothetical protein
MKEEWDFNFPRVYSKVYPLFLFCEEKKQKLKGRNKRALLKRGVQKRIYILLCAFLFIFIFSTLDLLCKLS